MTLDLLRSEDLDDALALSAGEGWNQTAADWSRLIALEPSGCFAARAGGRLVGTVTTITYGRALAWVGMMVVHPESRGQGIGAALMRAALDSLHTRRIASVMLDATSAGRPLYESLGFAAEAEIERWQGVAQAGGGLESSTSNSDWRHALSALDQAAYGADRSPILERLAAESVGGPLVVGSADGSPAGYALAHAGRTATYIGPLVAMTADAAAQLLDGMLARLAGREVCLDLRRGGRLDPEALAERGLSKRRDLTRMRYGEPRGARTTRSLCASAGPELG